jgi:hypothetical protein
VTLQNLVDFKTVKSSLSVPSNLIILVPKDLDHQRSLGFQLHQDLLRFVASPSSAKDRAVMSMANHLADLKTR